ncbi:uncharacterized protein CXQ87_004903 [Candidozyma duobushaemuli]|uniref:Uncharacterized protein n=1 Tax=Candidozyma duobushaemuli TaxID=1231522 RepID=A0A2V1AFA6_9ASCO|nr:uncharacterized protein CXQ87_004903 [[Candida] duobushaemulonis]PVH16608.1 hypothetical protein CXQ87_004903 [[Candida] duobushaemulonis]
MAPASKKSLVAVLSAQRHRPPKKFSPSLITDVYDKVKSHTDLDNLQEGYLQNVAWKFFHADVTNNHVELILAIVFYTSVVGRSQSQWSLLSSDSEKLNTLLQRVLQTTLNALDESIVDFEYLSYVFLSVVLRNDPEALMKHELFDRWLDSILESYTNHFLSGEFSVTSAKTASALVYLLGVARVEKADAISEAVDSRCFLSVFANCEDPQLKHLIDIQSEEPSFSQFSKLQEKARELGFGLLGDCLSPYDLTRSDLVENLVDLDFEKLKKFAGVLGYEGDIEDPDFLADVVIRKAVPQLKEQSISELELFDSFNHPPTLGLQIPAYFASDDHLKTWEYQLFSSINRHLQQCLQRLNITKDGIQGTSRYYSAVEKSEGKGSDLELSLSSGRKDVRQGDYVVLLHLEKPVKHEHFSRVCKYGLMKARLVEVKAVSQKALTVSLAEENRPYNGLITLPSLHNVRLLPSLEESNIDLLKSKTVERLWKVEGIHESFTTSTKKRRKDNENSTIIDYKASKFEISDSDKNLSEDQSRALLEILSSSVSYISCLPHSGGDTLVRTFLETIYINQGVSERCLVILPTTFHLERLSLTDRLVPVTYKCGDIHSTRSKADKLLRHVGELAKYLQLEDFDFTSSLRNAIVFYDSQIKPRWDEYLKTLKETFPSVLKYPFASLQFEKDTPVKDALDAVVKHYHGIKGTFAQIQRLLPLDKADIERYPDDAEKAISSLHPFVVCASDSVHLVGNSFKHVISFVGAETEAVVTQDTERVVFFGDSNPLNLQPLVLLEESGSVRPEIASLVGKRTTAEPSYNPGLQKTTMMIKVPSSEKQVNVDEATFIVGLYQFMRLLGYRHEDISLVVTSPYMKLLVEEILEGKEIRKGSRPGTSSFEFGWPVIQLASEPLVPSKYVLFSTHGDLSFKDFKNAVISSSLGFYAFGSLVIPPFDKPSTLSIYTGANLSENIDDRETGQKHHIIEDSEHMAGYVDQILQAKRAQGTQQESA